MKYSVMRYSLVSSLNGLRALGACHKLAPISNAQNLSSGFIDDCGAEFHAD